MRWIASILVLMFLAACGSNIGVEQPATEPTAPSAVQVQPAKQPAAPAEQEVQEVAAPEPTEQVLSADAKKIQSTINEAEGRLRSYSYYYRDQRPDPDHKYPIAGLFKIKGPKIRIDIVNQPDELSARQANVANSDASLYQPQIYGDDYYDRFFLNTEKKIAYARCDNSLCKFGRNLKEIEFSEYVRKTPMDWRNEIPLGSARIVDSKQIQGQNIMRVQYEQDGQRIMQWLETYSMVPIKVEIGPEGSAKIIEFENLAPNSVSDKEFEGVPI